MEFHYGQLNSYAAKLETFKADNVAKNLDAALNEIEKLKARIAKNEKIIHEKDEVNHELMIEYGKVKKDREIFKEVYNDLQKQYLRLKEEMAVTKKTTEIANDHILELEMENNMLRMSIKK